MKRTMFPGGRAGGLAVALLAAAALPAVVLADAATEKTIRELEQAQARAAIAGDRAALERSFAPDFVVINPQGAVATREELLRLLSGGAPPYRSAEYETQRIRDFGDTIVTIGLETVVMNQGPQAGQRVQRRTTQVWHREGGAWRLQLRHANLVQ